MKDRDITINYVDVQDHHKLGKIDRFVRTLREKVNKYLVIRNTTKYIDVLPKNVITIIILFIHKLVTHLLMLKLMTNKLFPLKEEKMKRQKKKK